MNVLKGCNCIVTGASGGLGSSIAAAFWQAGASIMLIGRRTQMLTQVVESLPPALDQQLVVLDADLNDPEAPERIVVKARGSFDTLDVLVNNAGIQGPIGPAWENEWDAWQTTMQINLLAPVALCRLCVSWMAERRRGKIINLSGGGATSPRPNYSAYATAKAGLVRFSETLAEETHDLGIDINCVAPGAMSTSLLVATIEAGPEAAGQKEYSQALRLYQGNGMGLERPAALCVFLASPASDGVSGKLISAVWDPWETLPEHLADLQQTDVYTLRRIVPRERGMEWGER